MTDIIPSIELLSAPALLGLAILLLFTGRLFTKTSYDEKKDEAERWRQAYEKEREARTNSDAQVKELTEIARTTQHFLEAIFYNAQRMRKSGGESDDEVLEETVS